MKIVLRILLNLDIPTIIQNSKLYQFQPLDPYAYRKRFEPSSHRQCPPAFDTPWPGTQSSTVSIKFVV